MEHNRHHPAINSEPHFTAGQALLAHDGLMKRFISSLGSDETLMPLERDEWLIEALALLNAQTESKHPTERICH